MAKVAIKKPELPANTVTPDVLDMPVLVVSPLTPADRQTNEPVQQLITPPPDYQDALRQAVNSLLQQQARIKRSTGVPKKTPSF